MVVLTAADAQNIRLAKRNVSHETYKQIFEMVINRIQNKAEMNQTSLRYRIPHFLVGRPAINVHHAARYVSEKLRFYGYKSSFHEMHGHYFVDVDWSREPVRVPKKPRDIKRPKQTSAPTGTQEAMRRLETIKLQLQNTLKKK